MLFLASVTGREEAMTALDAGADVIDLKDPAGGALGAVDVAVLDETLAAVAGRRPVSAVAGDLPMEPDAVHRAVAARRAADFVKIGLFPAPVDARCAVVRALAPLAAEMRLVGVLFADADPPVDRLDELAEAGFHGAMLDTLGKAGGGLLDHMPVAACADFVEKARALGLATGLAGSLQAADIPRLAVACPDYLGFRGALTRGGRAAPIDAHAAAAIGATIARHTEATSGEATVEPVGGDRIFVRDFVLPFAIGAYDHERGRLQDVRFSVDATIEPIAASAASIGDVYSYDVIMDAIRGLSACGHTDLVETLAVELAETLLGDRRLRQVTVRVEKLDLGPAAVGVEITRTRRIKDLSPAR